MNRRIVSIIILVLSLSLFGFLLYSTSFNDRLDKFYVSEDEWAKITESRDEDITLNISPLKINYEKPFVSDGNVLYYSMIDGDANRLNPTIQIGSGLKIAIKGEKLSDSGIGQNYQQDVIVYDSKFYRTFKLVTTNLPIMAIKNSEGESPDSRIDVDFSMQLYDNRKGVFERMTSSYGMSHKRGGSSFSVPKGSYSIKLTQKSVGDNIRPNRKSLLGMRESNNWMLHNIAFDFEHVRDYFATKLWSESSAYNNSFGFNNSVEWEYVELIMDDKYFGLYLLGHKPDDEMIGYDETAEHPDIMFKANELDEFYNFVTDKTDYLDSYELVTDGVDRKTAYSVLKDYIKSLYGSDLDKLNLYSDFNNAIDFNLFVNVIQNIDTPRWAQGMVKNTYITFKWDNDHYRAVLTPWDYDMALGTDSLFSYPYNMSPESNVLLPTDYVAARVRMEDTEVYLSLASRYVELRRSYLTDEHVNSLIDLAESKVFDSGAQLRDEARWPELHHYDVGQKLSDFRKYFASRLAYLDSYYLPYSPETQEHEAYQIPNYITVYLSTGTLLSPDDPEYLEAKPEEIEDESDVAEDEVFYYDFDF